MNGPSRAARSQGSPESGGREPGVTKAVSWGTLTAGQPPCRAAGFMGTLSGGGVGGDHRRGAVMAVMSGFSPAAGPLVYNGPILSRVFRGDDRRHERPRSAAPTLDDRAAAPAAPPCCRLRGSLAAARRRRGRGAPARRRPYLLFQPLLCRSCVEQPPLARIPPPPRPQPPAPRRPPLPRPPPRPP